MQSLFVTGTDTGVGKTHISCLIVRALRSRGHRVGAYKPVCSGAVVSEDGQPEWDDLEALFAACAGEASREQVCPQRFLAPVAPNLAARMEGRRVDDQLLITGARDWHSHADILVIEGAGGLLSPLSDSLSNLDLAAELQSAVVIVAANRLGVINHTRLTVAAITLQGLNIEAIVLNELLAGSSEPEDQSLASNADQLRYWLPDIPLSVSSWQSQELVWTDNAPTTGVLGKLSSGN